MFAVVKTGGKQYRVAAGDVIRVEKLPVETGALIELDQVLMLGNGAETSVGNPLVSGAAVTATVLEQMRDDTILVFKKKRRHNYRRKRGHRQALTVLRIAEVVAPGAERKVTAAQVAAPKPAAEGAAKRKAASPKAKAESAPRAPAKARTKAKPAAGAKSAAKPKAAAKAKPSGRKSKE